MSGCGQQGSTRSGCVEFESDVLEWLEAIGAIKKGVDKDGKETGHCMTALGPLMQALVRLVPGAATLNDYVLRLNELAGLGSVGTFLQMLAGATPAQKNQIQAALVGCLVSPAVGNDLHAAPDGGLFVNVSAPTLVSRIVASAPALKTLAPALLSADADQTIFLGTDGLLKENDATRP